MWKSGRTVRIGGAPSEILCYRLSPHTRWNVESIVEVSVQPEVVRTHDARLKATNCIIKNLIVQL